MKIFVGVRLFFYTNSHWLELGIDSATKQGINPICEGKIVKKKGTILCLSSF